MNTYRAINIESFVFLNVYNYNCIDIFNERHFWQLCAATLKLRPTVQIC